MRARSEFCGDVPSTGKAGGSSSGVFPSLGPPGTNSFTLFIGKKAGDNLELRPIKNTYNCP